jgi:hypothetical protein
MERSPPGAGALRRQIIGLPESDVPRPSNDRKRVQVPVLLVQRTWLAWRLLVESSKVLGCGPYTAPGAIALVALMPSWCVGDGTAAGTAAVNRVPWAGSVLASARAAAFGPHRRGSGRRGAYGPAAAARARASDYELPEDETRGGPAAIGAALPGLGCPPGCGSQEAQAAWQREGPMRLAA